MGEVKKYFEGNETICLMAENGGYIQHNGETLLADYMNKEDVYKLVNYVNTLDGMAAMLSGKKAMYAFNKDKALISQHTSHFSITYVDTLEDIEDDIFKITVCDPIDPVKNCLEGPLSSIKDFEVKPSGDCWIDIIRKDSLKQIVLSSYRINLVYPKKKQWSLEILIMIYLCLNMRIIVMQ